MAPARHPLRSYIVALFRRGEIVSVHEATLICDASRQAVAKWVKAEGINIEALRYQYLARKRTAAMQHVDSKSGKPRTSRRQRWLDTQRAVRRFNEANSTESG